MPGSPYNEEKQCEGGPSMDQALQERLDRIEQRMDTFEEKLEQGKAELIQASAHNMHCISENSVEKKLNLALESLQQQS